MEKILLDILKDQIKPALGCTEPSAVAYAVSRAKEILNEDIERLVITVDKKLFKNGMGVYIPGTKEKGLTFASALAIIIGKSELNLECLKEVDENSIFQAKEIVKSKIIDIKVKDDENKIHIAVEALSKNNKSNVIIRDNHTNIVHESLNDKILISNSKTREESSPLKLEILKYTISDLVDFVDNIPIGNLFFIKDGIEMNLEFAEIAKSNLSKGVGSILYENSIDIFSRAKAMTALASEARMSGSSQSVMSTAGSGNNGLIATVPISIIGKEQKKSEDEIIRAVTLSHLISIYIKAHLGPLSPVCGGGIAGGGGFACALTYISAGSKEQVSITLNNMIAGLSGMVCDGAKIGCAYKLSLSVDTGKDSALMALANVEIPDDNGILGDTIEESINNLGTLSNIGMNNTDRTIIDIMLRK